MKNRSRTSVLLAVALCAGALVVGSARAQASTRAASPRTTLAKSAIHPSLVTTDGGISLAMWTLDSRPGESHWPTTTLRWAVQRPGHAWTEPRTMATWRVNPYSHGLPQLATASGGRVTAAWLDRRRRVVVEDWSPRSGWSRATHLSNLAHRARAVSIASNDAGRVAVSWSQLSRRHPDRPVPAMVAVRRDGAWLVRRAGEVSPDSHSVGLPVLLGIDADGAVTAAWHHLVQGRGPSLVNRMAAAATSFETPAVFAESYGLGLTVQPDGAAMLNPGEATGDVFTRVDDGDWTDQGELPFETDALTTPSGALVTWNAPGGVNEDPDGIVGPQPLAGIGSPAFPRLAYPMHVLVTSTGELVAITTHLHRVFVSVRPDGGSWSAVRTAYADGHRLIREVGAVSMSPAGHVTMLLMTRAPGSHVHSLLRLDAIDFHAG
jgi:hypothetical protein